MATDLTAIKGFIVEQLKQRATARPARRALAAEVLELLVRPGPFSLEGVVNSSSEKLLAPVLTSLADIRRDLLVEAGFANPGFVSCPGGRIHRLLTPRVTFCGWKWQLCPEASHFLQAAVEAALICKTCKCSP